MFFELGNLFKVLFGTKKKIHMPTFFYDVVVKIYVYNIVNVILLVVNFLASQANKALLFIFLNQTSLLNTFLFPSLETILRITHAATKRKKRKPNVNAEFFKQILSVNSAEY